MRRLLLTSSQVSLLISGICILLCTIALFLSGYVVQQRTLRDLREAIRPRERVVIKPHLPNHFRPRFNALDDGSVQYLESEAEEEAKEMRKYIEVRKSSAPTSERQDTPLTPRQEAYSKATKKQLEILSAVKRSVSEKSWTVENPDPLSKNKVPITAAQRRRMIKEELKRVARNKESGFYHRWFW